MKRGISISMAILSLSGCSHGPTRSVHWEMPPSWQALPSAYFSAKQNEDGDQSLAQGEKSCDSAGCRWRLGYLRAMAARKNFPAKSCELFSGLSQEKEFALQRTALLRKLQACPANPGTFAEALEQAHADQEGKWLKKEFLSEARRQAFAIMLPQDFLSLTYELVKALSSKKLKTSLLLEAKPLAAQLGEESSRTLNASLGELAPRFNPVPTDWMATATDAMYGKDYDLAIDGFEKVLSDRRSPSAVKRKALESMRQCHKILQDKPKVIAASEGLVRLDESLYKADPGQANLRNLLNSTLALARVQWTEHHAKTAQKILTGFEKRFFRKINMTDIYVTLARIEEEAKSFHKAMALYEKAMANDETQTGKDLLQWRLAWLSYKTKMYAQAAASLQGLLEREQDPSRKNQEMFWLAEIQKRRKLPEAADTFKKIIQDDPIGYYGTLAYRELGLRLPKLTALESSGSKLPRRLPVATQGNWERLEWLISVDELAFAKSVLDEENTLPDPTIEEWQEVAQNYARASNFAAVFGKISKLSAEDKRNLLIQHPDLLFPTPYRELVEQAAKKSDIAPELAYAIMRQESSFNPDVISGADAYGLMQLLPSVAERIAKKNGVRYAVPDDLLDPSVNIPIGVAYLRELWEKFDGQFVMVTASYNASEDAVRGWVKTRYRGDALEFVEDIPYEETRGYVKLILRNMTHYMRLNAQSDPVGFPEWCLSGLQAFKF